MVATSRHGYAASQQITKRLDVLSNLQSGFFGVSWWFVRVFLVAGGTWAMSGAQFSSFNYMTGSVDGDLPMTSTQRAHVNTFIMLGAFVGAFVFGSLADAHGRKFALLISFVLTHSAGALCAVSTSVHVLILFRLIIGLGLGGQQPILSALIMELAPTSIRGQALVYLDAFLPLGTICAVVLSREIEPTIGWRAVSALSAAALFYVPLIYYVVPESPKWLATSGKIEEAVRVLRKIEEASSMFHDEDADDIIKTLQRSDQTNNSAKHVILQAHKASFCKLVANRIRILLRFPYLSRTLMLWFVWTGLTVSNSAMCAYLDEDFIAQIADASGKTMLVYSVLLAQLLGNLSACALIDRIGRRYTLMGFLLIATGGLLLEMYLERTTLSMTLSSCCRNFAFMGAMGCLYTYTPELYPASIRVIGIGYAWGISRLGAFAGPYAAIWMEDHLYMSIKEVTWVFCTITLAVVVVVLAVGIETAHYDVERATRRSSSLPTTDHETNNGTTAMLAYQKHEDEDERMSATQPIHII